MGSGSQPDSQRLRKREAEGKERNEGVWKIGAGHLERRRTEGGREGGREMKNRWVGGRRGWGWLNNKDGVQGAVEKEDRKWMDGWMGQVAVKSRKQ